MELRSHQSSANGTIYGDQLLRTLGAMVFGGDRAALLSLHAVYI